MKNTGKHTAQSQQPNTQVAASGNGLWASLSENQQEHVSGGWPKIKWPPGGGGGGGGSNCTSEGSIT